MYGIDTFLLHEYFSVAFLSKQILSFQIISISDKFQKLQRQRFVGKTLWKLAFSNIYRKLHLQKLKIFRKKQQQKTLMSFLFLLKT